MSASKRYLGDGLYVDFDGYQLVLTAEDGVSILNKVFLEPQVWAALKRYVKELEEQSQANNPTTEDERIDETIDEAIETRKFRESQAYKDYVSEMFGED